jgi:hypothetical protein
MVRGADCEGLLAGFALLAGRQEGREPLATVVGWLDRDGHWTEEEHAVGDRLLEAARSDAHTAVPGEAMLVERMAQATRRELTEWLARVPVPTPRWDTLEVRLTGLVLFRSDGRLGDGRRS